MRKVFKIVNDKQNKGLKTNAVMKRKSIKIFGKIMEIYIWLLTKLTTHFKKFVLIPVCLLILCFYHPEPKSYINTLVLFLQH